MCRGAVFIYSFLLCRGSREKNCEPRFYSSAVPACVYCNSIVLTVPKYDTEYWICKVSVTFQTMEISPTAKGLMPELLYRTAALR